MRLAACPRCKVTTRETTFQIIEEAAVYYDIEPMIDSSGRVWFRYIDGTGRVDWDNARIDPGCPHIICGHCGHEFTVSEFMLREHREQ